MRVAGWDPARTVIEVPFLEGGRIRSGRRVAVAREALRSLNTRLRGDDHVVSEAPDNTAAIVKALQAHVARVVVTNPFQVQLIAEPNVKTDRIDAAVLARLHANGLLPETWIPDEVTKALRPQTARRSQSVRQRLQMKNESHSALAAHLLGKCPARSVRQKGERGSVSSRSRWMSGSASSNERVTWIGRTKIRQRSIGCYDATDGPLPPASAPAPR